MDRLLAVKCRLYLIVKQCSKRIISQLLNIFRLLPLVSNRLMFDAFDGTAYTCNPMYISEYIHEMYHDKYEIIWAIKDVREMYYLPSYITVVKYKSLRHIIYRMTSKAIITNNGSTAYIPIRKNQLYINTWHGGGAYKKIAFGVQRISNNMILRKETEEVISQVNLFVSSSRQFTDNVIRGNMKYDGKVLECGMPRNDILLNASIEQKQEIDSDIRNIYNIVENSHLVLYAPTYRSNGKRINLDIAMLVDTLESKFGGKWIVLTRGHHFDSEFSDDTSVVDVTKYYDMQKILLIVDILITDYSSSMWDFSLTKKPGFLFTPDLKFYRENQGFDSPVDFWPYPYAETMKELCDNIRHYDSDKACAKIIEHLNDLQCMESGNATKILGEYIDKYCFSKI